MTIAGKGALPYGVTVSWFPRRRVYLLCLLFLSLVAYGVANGVAYGSVPAVSAADTSCAGLHGEVADLPQAAHSPHHPCDAVSVAPVADCQHGKPCDSHCTVMASGCCSVSATVPSESAGVATAVSGNTVYPPTSPDVPAHFRTHPPFRPPIL